MVSPFLQQGNTQTPEEIQSLLNQASGGVAKRATGLATDFLWALSRPFHAVMGGLGGMADDGVVGGAKGFWGGLTGTQKDVYAGDVMGKIGVGKGPTLFTVPFTDWEVKARDPFAFAANLALDPLMYVGVGGLSKTGKVAEKAMGTLDEAGNVLRGLQPTISKQFRAGERMTVSFLGEQIPIVGELIKPAFTFTSDAFRWGKTSKIMEGIFGKVSEPFMKSLQRENRSLRAGIVSDIEPQVYLIQKGIQATAKRTNRSEREIADLFVKYAEVPTENILLREKEFAFKKMKELSADISEFKDLSQLKTAYKKMKPGDAKTEMRTLIRNVRKEQRSMLREQKGWKKKFDDYSKRLEEGDFFNRETFKTGLPTESNMLRKQSKVKAEYDQITKDISQFQTKADIQRKYDLLPKGEEKKLLRKHMPKLSNSEKSLLKKQTSLSKELDDIGKQLNGGKLYPDNSLQDFLTGDNNFFDTLEIFHDINRQLLKIEQVRGIKVGELKDAFSYFPRVATQEFRRMLKARHGSEMKEYYSVSEFLSHALPRDIRGKTLGEANDMLRKEYNLFGNAFILDPAAAMYGRVQSHAKSVSSIEFLEEAFKVYGRIGVGGSTVAEEFSHLGRHWTRPSSPAIKRLFTRLQKEGRLPPDLIGIKDFSKIVFPDKIASILDDSIKLYDDSFQSFEKMFGWYNKRFKPMVTVLFPAYHVRNVFDDTIRAHLGGLRINEKATYEAYKEASTIMYGASQLRKSNLPAWSRHYSDSMLAKLGEKETKFLDSILPGIKSASGKEMTRAELYEELVTNGIVGTGFWDSELWRGYESIIKDRTTQQGFIDTLKSKGRAGEFGAKAIYWIDPVTSPLMRGPKKLASMREDLTRSAMFIKLRKDGFSAKSSANKVMKYMYDYLDLGPGDKIMKSLIPFWSFTRQNIPFWMSATVQHPMAFSALSKAIGGVTSDPDSGEFLPRIISEGIPIQISPTKNGKSTFMYSFGLSMEDLNRIVKDDKLRTLDKFFLSSLTPLLKFPLERSADKNFFFSTKISSYQKSYRVLKGLPQSWLDFIDFKEKVDRNGVTYFRMNPYMLHFISNTPLSRAYTTLGKMSDSERTWSAWAIDDLMGVKTKVFDLEQEKKRYIKKTVKKYLQQQNVKTGDVRAMEILYVPKEQRENVDPAILELVKAFSKSGKVLQ